MHLNGVHYSPLIACGWGSCISLNREPLYLSLLVYAVAPKQEFFASNHGSDLVSVNHENMNNKSNKYSDSHLNRYYKN